MGMEFMNSSCRVGGEAGRRELCAGFGEIARLYSVPEMQRMLLRL